MDGQTHRVVQGLRRPLSRAERGPGGDLLEGEIVQPIFGHYTNN